MKYQHKNSGLKKHRNPSLKRRRKFATDVPFLFI